jgi:hypothetical protein
MQLQTKLEIKGFKIIHNIGYKNGEQTIISYSLKNENGRIIKTENSLSKLLRK